MRIACRAASQSKPKPRVCIIAHEPLPNRSGEAITQRWTAIVLAGQRPGPDPLATAFGAPFKALVQVEGEAMLSRVLRTLTAAPSIARIVVLAQNAPDLFTGDVAWAANVPNITTVISESGIASSIAATAGSAAAPWPVLVTTADHPLLTVGMVENFLSRCANQALGIGVVERTNMLAAYPGSRRTWLKFADGSFSGANLFALADGSVLRALQLWSQAEQDRKRAFSLFLHFGPWLAARAITRTIGLHDALRIAGKRLGVRAGLIVLSEPEAGIDVDKPDDHRLVSAILRGRKDTNPSRATVVLSVFDLDRTLTRHPTYTRFLVFACIRLNPARLLLAPAIAACMIGYKLGLIERMRLKELQQQLLVGARVSKARIDPLARAFAERLGADGFYAEGLARIERERCEGRRVILATAACDYYAEAIAERLGIADLVATKVRQFDGCVTARIEGPNCYGMAKRMMLGDFLQSNGFNRAQSHVRFFSDHLSDRATFEWSDEPVAVNPSKRLRRLAQRRNWAILDW